jgi:hypothetical protein
VSDTFDHPEMGTLRWEAEWSWWFTQIESPIDGGWLDVIVDPGEGDRIAFLGRAGELYHWALAHQGRILREAVEAELLELYNAVWRQGGEPELTAEEMTVRLTWTLLNLSVSEIVPVSFGYAAQGGMFGGHSVDVEVDGELHYRDIDLVG